MKQWRGGILLFPEVEVLDFAGPYEVFSLAEYEDKSKIFEVSTVAETNQVLKTSNGLKVKADYDFSQAPLFDFFIVPGGDGARLNEIHNEKVIAFIKKQKESVQILASVCTGAFLLAKAQLLNGKHVTTHWERCDNLAKDFPKLDVIKQVKYVDEGDIITSGGISAGIVMSFHILERLVGKEIVQATAKQMEYDL